MFVASTWTTNEGGPDRHGRQIFFRGAGQPEAAPPRPAAPPTLPAVLLLRRRQIF